MRVSKARRMRRFIEALADHLKDEEAVEAPELFRKWNSEHSYEKGQRVRYEGLLYRCLQSHDARSGLNPVEAPDFWEGILYERNSRESRDSGWEEVS